MWSRGFLLDLAAVYVIIYSIDSNMFYAKKNESHRMENGENWKNSI